MSQGLAPDGPYLCKVKQRQGETVRLLICSFIHSTKKEEGDDIHLSAPATHVIDKDHRHRPLAVSK